MERCIYIIFYIKQRNHVTEEHQVLKTTYGKKDLSMSRIFRSFCIVRSADMTWKSGLRNGRVKPISNVQVAENMYIALSRDRRLTLRTTENKLNLNIESIRSTTYTDLDKRRICAGKLWITICVLRKNSEGRRPLQILWMTPEIDLVLRMPSCLGFSITIPRLKDTWQNGDRPGHRYQKVFCF